MLQTIVPTNIDDTQSMLSWVNLLPYSVGKYADERALFRQIVRHVCTKNQRLEQRIQLLETRIQSSADQITLLEKNCNELTEKKEALEVQVESLSIQNEILKQQAQDNIVDELIGYLQQFKLKSRDDQNEDDGSVGQQQNTAVNSQ